MYIFLTGFMASGKTKNGRIMAKRLGYTFFDLDHLIEAESNGLTINEIYENLGEEAFRQLELDTLIAHTDNDRQNIIFSLGGGTFSNPIARKWILQKGKVIFLNVPVGVLFQRLIVKKTTRPLLRHLSDQELLDKITTLHEKRLPDYLEAHHVLPNFRGTERDRMELERLILKK
ncbi:MAG TPA: shikimate kinase [Saprospiraceae bacterium]|nr:shikimate kinase [Saprospiraceae bacterium]